MKKIILVFCTFILLLSQNGFSQTADETKKGFFQNTTLDFGLAGGEHFAAALSWSKLYGIGKSKKFKIGYGLRFTSFLGSKTELITAPARLTSGETGPQVIFSGELKEGNLDTLKLDNSQTNSLNAAIYLQYSLSPKLEIGFNIDAIGFTFGGEQHGHFYSSLIPTGHTRINAKPTAFNALLISDNDIGSLNSELTARYWFNEKWALRGGISFIFIEYQTERKIVLDNDRFRYKGLLGLVAVSYRL